MDPGPLRTIPLPVAAAAEPQKRGLSRGFWIAGGVAILLIAAGVGLGVGLGLPSKSKGSNSDSSSRTPIGPASSINNGTTTPGAPSAGLNTTTNPSRGAPTAGSPTSPTIDPAGVDPLNTTELPLAALDQFVAWLNETAVSSQDPDWLALVEIIEDNRQMFLLYLRARKLNDVLSFLQATRNDTEGFTGADEREARAALLSALNFRDFRRWLRGTDRTVPPLSPKQLAALKAYEPYIDEQIKAEFDDSATNTTEGPDLRDPIVQLAQFTQRIQAAGLTFTTLLDPAYYSAVQKSSGGRKMKAADALPPLGHSWFKPSRVGLVFHVLNFPNGAAIFPGNTPKVRAQFTYIIEAANRFYRLSGTNIEFYLKELRIDDTQYPYLALQSLADYQGCAQKRQECLCLLAQQYNYKPDTYVNIWVNGFLRLMTDEAVLAYSSSLPPVLDTCAAVLAGSSSTTTTFFDEVNDPTNLAFDPITTPPAQHIWMAYENLQLQSVYNRTNYDAGGATLAHELGHFLGLMHTHDAGCVATDFVADTPPNQLIDEQPWAYTALSPWCRALRSGQRVSVKALRQFDSCTRDDNYIDNVFNLMSYSPPSCQLLFTPGQVDRMQRIATVYRKKMLQPAS